MSKLIIIIAIGWASQYHQGISESVIHVRQTSNVHRSLPLDIPQVDGYIAVRDCHHIGEIWHLRPVGRDKVESFWVIDCAGSQETREWMNTTIIAEVDWQTAVRWRTVGRGIKVERVLPIERGIVNAETNHQMDMPQVQPMVASPRYPLCRWHAQEEGVEDHAVQTGGWDKCWNYPIN